MKRNKIIIVFPLILWAFLLSVLPIFSVEAKTYIDKINYANKNFSFNVADTDNNIDSLSVSGQIEWLKNQSTPIDIKFVYTEGEKSYNISITNGKGDNKDYGDYKIDNGASIKILPSEIKIKDTSILYNNTQDTLGLFARFYTDSNTNRLSLNPDVVLNPGQSLGQADTVKIDDIYVKLVFSIPVTVKDPATVEDKEGYPLGVFKDSGRPVMTSVIAKIEGDLNGLSFSSGTLGEDFTVTGSNDEPEESIQKRPAMQGDQKAFQGSKGLTMIDNNVYKGISSVTNFQEYIVGITNFILSFVVVIAVTMLIYGGYLWIVDQGDDQMTEKGKKIIAGSVIGILIIISAYTIVNTVINLDGTPPCEVSISMTGQNSNIDCQSDIIETVGGGVSSLLGVDTGNIGDSISSLVGGLLGNFF